MTQNMYDLNQFAQATLTEAWRKYQILRWQDGAHNNHRQSWVGDYANAWMHWLRKEAEEALYNAITDTYWLDWGYDITNYRGEIKHYPYIGDKYILIRWQDFKDRFHSNWQPGHFEADYMVETIQEMEPGVYPQRIAWSESWGLWCEHDANWVPFGDYPDEPGPDTFEDLQDYDKDYNDADTKLWIKYEEQQQEAKDEAAVDEAQDEQDLGTDVSELPF